MKKINFPNILTLLRLVLSPLFLPILLVYLLPLNSFLINLSLAFLFLLFGITDFFDGFLARKYSQETKIGRILDPIADKFLVFSTLIALLAANKIYFYWAILLIGREIFLMGLRIFSLEHGIDIRVFFLGKLKTFSQIGYIIVVILNPHKDKFITALSWDLLEYLLLGVTLFLSLYSAYLYYRSFLNEYNKEKQIENQP